MLASAAPHLSFLSTYPQTDTSYGPLRRELEGVRGAKNVLKRFESFFASGLICGERHASHTTGISE